MEVSSFTDSPNKVENRSLEGSQQQKRNQTIQAEILNLSAKISEIMLEKKKAKQSLSNSGIESKFQALKDNFFELTKENDEMSLKIENLNKETEKLKSRVEEERVKALKLQTLEEKLKEMEKEMINLQIKAGKVDFLEEELAKKNEKNAELEEKVKVLEDHIFRFIKTK